MCLSFYLVDPCGLITNKMMIIMMKNFNIQNTKYDFCEASASKY